jgi:hypothetical protein
MQFLQRYLTALQVGVQTEVEPEAGANALEDRVNAVLPLQNKEDEDDEDEEDN